MGLIGNMIEGAFGIGTSIYNNEMAKEREEQARLENYRYGEMAAQNADARTRALYSDLYSPGAQLNQLKEAGLSPSLFYGDGGGIAGQSGAQGTGAAGVNPNVFGIDPMMAAQIRNLDAQTDKLKEETKTEAGENERGAAEIAKYWSEKGRTDIESTVLKQEETAKKWQNYYTSKTTEWKINEAYSLSEQAATKAQIMVYDMCKAQNEAQWSEETLKDRIDQEKAKYNVLISEELLNKATANLRTEEKERVKAEINKWSEEIKQGWADLAIKAFEANTHRQFNKIIDDWYDKQVENLENRLNFDKGKFDKEFIYTIINDRAEQMFNFLGKVLSR